MTDIENECIRRIAEAKGIAPAQLGPDTTLESIAVDSLDRVSLSFDLEEQYGIEIAEVRLHSIRTIADVALAVRDALLAKQQKTAADEAGAA